MLQSRTLWPSYGSIQILQIQVHRCLSKGRATETTSKNLGSEMQVSPAELNKLSSSTQPSKELLDKWKHKAEASIGKLVSMLISMDDFTAQKIVKQEADKYYCENYI